MEQLGQHGSFLTWSHHENTVLNSIRCQMQHYGYSNERLKQWLDRVPNREGYRSPFMIDMCELAKIGYFHPKMKGRLSLKARITGNMGVERNAAPATRVR